MINRINFRIMISGVAASLILTGCSINVSVEPSRNNNDLIRPHSVDHEYVHGTDGYYNLLNDGIEFKLVGQISGTCWACAASCAVQTAYQKKHDSKITLDQMEIVNAVYDEDKSEGVFAKATDKGKVGGTGGFVVNELSREFIDGFILDGALDARAWSADEIKDGIRKYGALYIGIPDTDKSKKGSHDHYYTMNTPEPDENAFDHSIAVLGWDDNFPKEYFNVEASQDGAWITYNSNYPIDFYYVSYDTPFDRDLDTPMFMSVTDRYGKVLSYDCGWWLTDPVITGDTTTTANVFKGKGTLTAIGTYSLNDDQDITIRIMTPDLSECIYSQDAHIDLTGYHVIELNHPQEVDEYAIAITYTKGAPVEGESKELESPFNVISVCERGQSYILIDNEWMDMNDKSTCERCGMVTGNACIRALYAK